MLDRDEQILVARSPGLLNFERWRLILLGPHETYCMSPLWHLEFWGGSWNFGNFVHPFY